MAAKQFSRALALLMALPSASFALGLGDIRLLSPLNAPLDAEIELVDVTPEEMQSLKAQIASRDTFARYGLEWPVFLSSIQVRTVRNADGHQVIKLKSTDTITEPFITLLVEVNWARGRLVREYTVLLDPPVFTPGQSASGNAPVAAPAAGAGAREGAIARSAASTPSAESAPPASGSGEPLAATARTSEQNGGSASRRPSDASRQATSADSNATGPTPEGTTHVVKQGDTLSRIAAATTGSSANTPQTRSWMLAIYQANPRAFDKNMNLLRSGAVLRIPDTSSAAAISPSEANGEIRRQYAAWRSASPAADAASAAEQGRLRLVTPTESGSAGTAGSGTDTQALQGRVKDLEGQLSESKRLLELKNAELAQLQARLQGTKPAPASAPPAPKETAPAAPAPSTAPSASIAATPSATPETPPAAKAEPPSAPQAAPAPEPAAQTPAEAATRARKPHAAPAASEPSSGSLSDILKDYWWAVALAIVALLALFGLRAWRSRRQSEFDDSLGRLAVAGASSIDRGFGGDTAPVRSVPQGDSSFLVEESGSHQRPRMGGAAAAPSAARHVATDETMSSETAINLDQGDPLAEADFHMAYGLYDQAADLIRIAISREPNRRDLKLKLLEVFFVWGNKEQFLQSARELAETRAQAAPGEWEKIVIMGKQLAPDDPLFSGGGAVSGATAGGVDLDLEGGESRVDFDLLGEPIPGQTAAGEVDLDIGSALGDTMAGPEQTGSTDRNANLDHMFSSSSTGTTGTTRQMTQKIVREPEPVMPEYGSEAEGPTIEQPALGSQNNPTIRQKVAMALKQSHSADATAELAIDDLGLDLGALDTVDQPGLGSSPDAPTLVAGLDDRSRRVMEEAQRRAAVEEREKAAWRAESDDRSAARAKISGLSATGTYDVSATARLATLSGSEVDFDLGDADADGSHSAHSTNGSGLDLDVGTATVPDAAFTSTQKLESEDLALPDLEPVTMSEVGTKLDLARAYMDMGDPEGARNILDEVLTEGSVAQKQEAQRLIESLPG